MATRGKQLVRDTLAGQATTAVPFVPLVDTFAARHMQVPVRDFHGNAATLAKALDMARRLTKADAIVCLPDATLLAEACGCPVSWNADGPRLLPCPAGTALTLEPDQVLSRGRIPVLLDALERLRFSVGQEWALFGALTAPHLLSQQLWHGDLAGALAAGNTEARELVEATSSVCLQFAHRLGELEIDACLVMDGAEAPHAAIRELLAPAYETLATVIAFYGSTPIHHGSGVDWLEAAGISAFEWSLTNTDPARGGAQAGRYAAIPEAALRRGAPAVTEAARGLIEEGARMLGTARAIPADVELASVQAVTAASDHTNGRIK